MHFCHIEKHLKIIAGKLLLINLSFQTCMTYFLLLNTKEDFVECYQTILGILDLYCMDKYFLNFSNYVPQSK